MDALTGGEIFLRKDFFEIYDHARQLGLIVTLLNGTTVTERIAERLAADVPYSIEVTLYGRTRETYEKVTGVPGSHEKCYRGVELMLERGLTVKLKTIVMRTNQHELVDMASYAKGHGPEFKYDTMINPNFDGSLMPCNVRLSPEESVVVDFALPERMEEYHEYFEARKHITSSRVFSWGRGAVPFTPVSSACFSLGGVFVLRKASSHRIVRGATGTLAAEVLARSFRTTSRTR